MLKTLGIARSARSFVVTFNRPNIAMTVKSKKSMRDVSDFAKWLADRWGADVAGIVYCLSRDETAQLAAAISEEQRRDFPATYLRDHPPRRTTPDCLRTFA